MPTAKGCLKALSFLNKHIKTSALIKILIIIISIIVVIVLVIVFVPEKEL